MRQEIHPDNQNKNSKWLTARYEIAIDNTPEAIWNYAYNPETWTASNPDEHLGLVFYNKKNRPETGVAFYQKEKVAGVYADLRGHILYAKYPTICVWTGVAKYRIWGLLSLSVPENGVVSIEDSPQGSLLSHTVYLHIPNTIMGKIFMFLAERFADKKGYIPHTYKELLFFKEKLDRKK